MKVQANISLLAGRWSNPINGKQNFVLTFARKLGLDLISCYNPLFLSAFGDSCHVVPTARYICIALRGVLLLHPGPMPTSLDLRKELSHNTASGGLCILTEPRWLL